MLQGYIQALALQQFEADERRREDVGRLGMVCA